MTLRLRGDVLFLELREQDLGVGVAVPVVEDVDGAVGGLEAVGIRDQGAIVEEQALAPGLAVIAGKEGGHARAARQADVDGAVLHEQELAGGEPADEEAGAGVLNRRTAAARSTSHPCRRRRFR